MARGVEGLLFVGFLFLGMGLGLYYGRVDVGTLIGMGLGFIAMAATRAREKGQHTQSE